MGLFNVVITLLVVCVGRSVTLCITTPYINVQIIQ